MARRNQHSLAEIKALVLNTAETIIAEHGFFALTIRKIAVEMGYTVGSVYMVFDSRADLILHLNARTLAQFNAQLSPLSHTTDIETWLNAYLQLIRRHNQRWRVIFTPALAEQKPLPSWYQQQLNELFQQFAAYFPEPNHPAIQALWHGIHGICLLSVDETVEASVLLLVRAFLHAS